MSLEEELRNFEYRNVQVDATTIFPNLDNSRLYTVLSSYLSRQEDLHAAVVETALKMWDGGYTRFLEEFGFYQEGYECFDGHCHQITPILAVALAYLGVEDVHYLECRRVYPSMEPVPPQEEPDPVMRDEFVRVGRIPYCALGLRGDGEYFFMSGKHLKLVDGQTVSLLTSECHRRLVGEFPHQSDVEKSVAYLSVFPGPKNEVGWKKQVIGKDPEPELFLTFLDMQIKV